MSQPFRIPSLRRDCVCAEAWRISAAAGGLAIALLLLSAPAHAVTDLRFDGMTIVVHVPIEVRGMRRRIVDQETGEQFDAIPYIEREVERIWNDAFEGFSWECWSFRLDLELVSISWEARSTDGYHMVEVDPTRDRSLWEATGPDDMIPSADFPFAYTRDMVGLFNTPDPSILAHEIGHALGLGDDYLGRGVFKPEAGGIGDTAGGVVFLDEDGDPIQPGSFMTHGVGLPEPVHLARAVAMMKEAGMLPPCAWTGRLDWTERAENDAEPNRTGDEIKHDGFADVSIRADTEGKLSGTLIGSQTREYWYGYQGGPFCTATVSATPVTAKVTGSYVPADKKLLIELDDIEASMTEHLVGGDGVTLICDDKIPIDYYAMYLPMWFQSIQPADDWGFASGWDLEGKPNMHYSLQLKRDD
jgi:hypothetical protein